MTARALREVWLLAGLLAIGMALPLAVNAWAGVLDIPYSDEFTFRQTALRLYETGEIRLGGWSIMTFVGQLLAVQPLLALSGGTAWAFPVAGALFTGAGSVAGYALARRFLGPVAAAGAVLLVLTFPGVLVAAPTFMTDVPAWAAELVCLALGVRALGRDEPWSQRRVLFALSLAAGLYAFSIREFGLAAPVAVLVAASVGWWAERRVVDSPAVVSRSGVAPGPSGRGLVLAWLLTLGGCAGLSILTSSLPGQAPAQLHLPGLDDLGFARRAIATTALAVLPAVVLAGAAWLVRRRWRDRWTVAGAGVGLLAGALLFLPEVVDAVRGGLPLLIVGNVLSAAGSTGSGAGAGSRPALFVPPTWKMLNLAALAAVLAGLTLAGAWAGAAASRVRGRRGLERAELAARWLGSPLGLLAIFSGLYLAGILAFGLVASLFDRYLWPLFLPLAVLVLAGTGRPDQKAGDPAPGRLARRVELAARAAAGAIVAGLAVAALALLVNRAAFDAARWSAGRELVTAGIPADRIDAGYEWVGEHAARIVTPSRDPGPGERWYHLIVPDFRPCAIVASSSLRDPGVVLQDVDRAAYRLLLVTGPPVALYRYGVPAEGCP